MREEFNKRTIIIAAIVLVGMFLVVGLMVGIGRNATRQVLSTNVSPTVIGSQNSTDPVLAVVNDQNILHSAWQKRVALDTAMSILAGKTAPDAETTLDGLINQALVSQLTGNTQSLPGDAQAEQRIQALQQSWGKDAAAVDQALQAANLSRQDLLDEIKQLMVVETALQKISATESVDDWLSRRRAAARISIYSGLKVAQVSQATEAPATPAAVAPTAATVKEGVQVGEQAPDFSLPLLDGTPQQLSALRGKPVVLNFWASWCPPCRQEYPALKAAYEKYGEQGVAMYGVDLKENADIVRQASGDNGLNYPMLLDGDGNIAATYQVRGTPTTIFLDAHGVVAARHIGPLTEEQFDGYITPLLAQTAEEPAAQPVEAGAAVGDIAPDFRLPDGQGQIVHLSDYRDQRNVILVFYRVAS